MSVHERLEQLGLELPEIARPAGSYVPAQIVGNQIYASGQTPTVDGKLVYEGKVGAEISETQAYEAARLAALNCIGELKAVLGDLNRVRRIIKVTGYVASAPGFGHQPQVVNGASDLFLELWGDDGRHARAAIGVAELPFGAPVEVELIAEIEQ